MNWFACECGRAIGRLTDAVPTCRCGRAMKVDSRRKRRFVDFGAAPRAGACKAVGYKYVDTVDPRQINQARKLIADAKLSATIEHRGRQAGKITFHREADAKVWGEGTGRIVTDFVRR